MENTKKKVAILTTFYSLDPAYSLCAVVVDQLHALVKNGYKPVLFVLPFFEDKVPEGVEVRKIVPQIILEPYSGSSFPSHWQEDVKKCKDAFAENMKDIDILLCHDIFFIDTYLPYNIGMREALPELKLRILSWVHSAPSSRPTFDNNPHANRYSLPPRTKLVYLNNDKTNDLAEMYGAWLKDVRVVYNSKDPRTFWGLDPFVSRLVNEYDLLNSDIISVYPLSTPRMITGKGLDKAIKIHSKLKELGYKTKLIVCNAHSNADKEQKLVTQTKFWAMERGLDHNDLVFTSNEGFPNGVSQKVVSDLFRLANVFIFPTISEVCSLVMLEAMMSGNLMVLNKDVHSLYEFGGTNSLYMDFNYRPEEKENERYYTDLAKIIASQFESDKSLQTKRSAFKRHNIDSMFKQLELLFYEE